MPVITPSIPHPPREIRSRHASAGQRQTGLRAKARDGFPISYAVDGRQYIAVGTGTASTASLFGRLTPELRPSAGNNLFVFALTE